MLFVLQDGRGERKFKQKFQRPFIVGATVLTYSVDQFEPFCTMSASFNVQVVRACSQLGNSFARGAIKIQAEIEFLFEVRFDGL